VLPAAARRRVAALRRDSIVLIPEELRSLTRDASLIFQTTLEACKCMKPEESYFTLMEDIIGKSMSRFNFPRSSSINVNKHPELQDSEPAYIIQQWLETCSTTVHI
jgi:hypothetical protein